MHVEWEIKRQSNEVSVRPCNVLNRIFNEAKQWYDLLGLL